jgi:hypothetical protein
MNVIHAVLYCIFIAKTSTRSFPVVEQSLSDRMGNEDFAVSAPNHRRRSIGYSKE